MKESDSPIGRPARVQSPPARADKQPQARASFAYPARSEVQPVSVETALFDLPNVEAREVEARTALPFDFSEMIALGEMIAAAPGRETGSRSRPPSTLSADLRVAAAPTPAAAQTPVAQVPSEPAPTFIEPRQALAISKAAVAPCLTAINGDDALACQQHRTLAARLLNIGARRKLKTLLVTSARSQEGKSTVAINLAWTAAKPGERRVLLIDANPDRSSICRMLGINPQRGWIDLIEGCAQVSDAIVRIDPNGLYLLAAGAQQSLPHATPGGSFSKSDALASPRLEKLIEELERNFDFVIIDAPAIKSIDARRLASIADSVILVVRAGHTPHDEVTEALKLAGRDVCAGIVLNESKTKAEFTRSKDRKSLLARLFRRQA